MGGHITFYYKEAAGSWAEKLTREDATYGAAGYLGFYEAAEAACVWDDFGGGTVSPSPMAMHHYRMRRA
jgi:hypothetical protein